MSGLTAHIARVQRGRGIPERVVGPIPLGSGDPVALSRQFLRQCAAELGLDPDLRDLQLLRHTTSPGGDHVVFRQVHQGLPVFGATVAINIDKNGNLLLLTSDYHPHIPADGRYATEPPVTAKAATDIAINHTGGRDNLRDQPTLELGILPLEGRYPLVWRVFCPAKEPPADWRFEAHAETGHVLRWKDLLLTGPYAGVVDLNPPRITPPASTNGDFRSPPSEPAFADVMAYYWLDILQRYLRKLGFSEVLAEPIEVDAHDNTTGSSFYSPISKRVGFGSGRREGRPAMAQDATVILHELGHAVQDDQVPGWGESHKARSMGEGFGDILSAIYFAPLIEYHKAVVGDWARPPEGIRRVDTAKRYPEDMEGEPHADGQIWSGAIWDLYRHLGGTGQAEANRIQARDTVLRLLIQSHFFLPPDARFADGAEGLLLADQALHDGRHAVDIRKALAAHGIAPERDRSRAGVDNRGPAGLAAVIHAWPGRALPLQPWASEPLVAPVHMWPTWAAWPEWSARTVSPLWTILTAQRYPWFKGGWPDQWW